MSRNDQTLNAPVSILRRSYQIGRGVSSAHHGELFQGQIEDAEGRRRRCLVSLPCDRFQACVTVTPDDSGALRVEPAHKRKAMRVVRDVFEYYGAMDAGAHIAVSNNIEEGKGYGSSTADCVAAARAAADALGRRLTDLETARLVVAAETASDNIMFSRAVLFAQREAVVLEDYGRSFPDVVVLGVDTEESRIVDTLVHPPAEYNWREVYTFNMLVTALRRAFRTGNLELLGRVATASSMINERFLPKRLFREIHALAARTGVLGVSVAHTGTIVSALLDPADPRLEYKMEALVNGFDTLRMRKLFRFRTGDEVLEKECTA